MTIMPHSSAPAELIIRFDDLGRLAGRLDGDVLTLDRDATADELAWVLGDVARALTGEPAPIVRPVRHLHVVR